MRPEIRNQIRRQTREDFYALWSGWKMPRRRKPSEWATEVRRFAQGQSPLSTEGEIGWNFDIMPHTREPMEAAIDPEVNIVVLWLARRMAKTEGVCGNLAGWTVTDRPMNVYSLWPIEESRDKFSRDVIEPMIQATPELSKVFVERRSRDSGRTIGFKKFHGGSIFLTYAGSPSQMRGMAAGVVFVHEADAMPKEVKGEGDPIEKAFGRAEGFGDAIKIIESTGTLARTLDPATGKEVFNSRIDEWYEKSDKRKWFCPCRRCGVGQWLRFDQIREIKKKSGGVFFYLCEHCDTEHTEAQWRRMVLAGEWRPTAPFVNGIRGYWINGFNSLLPKGRGFKSKLHQFHAEEARSNSSPESRRVWINEVAGELWNPEKAGEAPPAWQPLYEAREDYGLTVPAKACYLTAFIDVQKYRLEVGWQAWGRDEETWGMDHVVIAGYVGDASTWAELPRELARPWRHANGGTMSLGIALIDGGKWPDVVYAFLRQLAQKPVPGVNGHLRASKGFGQHGHPLISQKMQTVGKVLKGHHIGTWEAKDRIYERLRMNRDEAREGVMHFNLRFSEEYFQQLTSEHVVVTYERGMEVRKYELPAGRRNEALDITAGNLAAFRLIPKNLDALFAALETPDDPEEEPPTSAPAAPYSPFGGTGNPFGSARGFRI